ncbi:hypothetical protein ACLOJK_022559 [Asimina triloba]
MMYRPMSPPPIYREGAAEFLVGIMHVGYVTRGWRVRPVPSAHHRGAAPRLGCGVSQFRQQGAIGHVCVCAGESALNNEVCQGSAFYAIVQDELNTILTRLYCPFDHMV